MCAATHGVAQACQFVGPSPRIANVVAFSLVMPNLSNSLTEFIAQVEAGHWLPRDPRALPGQIMRTK